VVRSLSCTCEFSARRSVAKGNLMRSRITWTILLFGVVLIGILLTHFSLTALQEPSSLETRIANLAKRSVIPLGQPPRDSPAGG